MDKNSTKYIVIVVFIVSLVCAIVVSTVSVSLRDMQKYNELVNQWKEVLNVLHISYKDSSADIEQKFSSVKVVYFDVDTGLVIENPTAEQKNPKMNFITLDTKQDVAKIFRRSNLGTAYLTFNDDNTLKNIAFSVSGYGLWSVMFAYISLESDLNTISSISFYKHAETPGLGGEIANPKWSGKFAGKKIKTENGEFRVIKGSVASDDTSADLKVDGIAGSTLTSNGVTNMMKFWFNTNDGYAKFIDNLKKGVVNFSNTGV